MANNVKLLSHAINANNDDIGSLEESGTDGKGQSKYTQVNKSNGGTIGSIIVLKTGSDWPVGLAGRIGSIAFF